MKNEGYKTKKNNIISILLIILIILFSAILFMLIKINKQEPIESSPITYIAEDKSEEGEQNVIYATLPGYSATFYLDEENKTVPLVNFVDNEVNLIYELIYEGQTILLTEEKKPGEGVDANLYDYFKTPGSYEVNLNVYTKLKNGMDGNTTNFIMNIEIIDTKEGV